MIVVGGGRIGLALKERSEAVGQPVALVDRDGGDEAWSGPPGVPVVLAVRNDDLEAVLARVPAARHPDLVVVQNGALREFLLARQLGRVTRGLLYVMVARRGDPPVAGGASFFSGPHADRMVRWFYDLGLPAEALDGSRFPIYELEKLLWLAAHGPLCAALGATVGEVATTHRGELAPLVAELARIGRAAWGVEPDPDWLLERLVAYSRAIPDYRASVKEWPWRNGWLDAQARRFGLPTPLHHAWLDRAGHPIPAGG